MEKRMLGIGDLVKMQNNDTVVWTVLGSCVSVIFHIPGFFSLMCHAQLPCQIRNFTPAV